MVEWKNGKALVYEDRHGNTRCGACCSPLWCNDCGNMPNTCPQCGVPLDYGNYNTAHKVIEPAQYPKDYPIDEATARRMLT